MATTHKRVGTKDTVHASPTKRFFVSMLTRDIELQDSILDLLDNSVDGILRSTKHHAPANKDRPYEGFWAKIIFNGRKFQIADNCGGIPLKLAKEYAFMMGRPRDEGDSDIPTVGMYGIGMKRAIFKMGSSSRVISKTDTEAFEVTITKEWMASDADWNLPLTFIRPPMKHAGVVIDIEDLDKVVATTFSGVGSSFEHTFITLVAQHYGFIINKGFKVYVNGKLVEPKPMTLLWTHADKSPEGRRIAPYLYSATVDGVKIRLVVGFYDQMLTEDELDEEQVAKRTKEDAGWTIICNDRVVVHNDKSRVTGWGEAGVPNYHNQFIGISGVVYFQSNDAWKLPITTTKRGVDSSSELYLYVKDFMREGLKKFTTYTNVWKQDPEEERRISSKAERISVSSILEMKPDKEWTKVRNRPNEFKYNAPLPAPTSSNPRRQIRFAKAVVDIEKVADHLFGDTSIAPGLVGEECFDQILKKARK